LVVLVATAWASTLLAMGVGLWWWWRAPANPTGRLLYLAGASQCSFVIAQSWPSGWAQLMWILSFLELPCLALIVFGWPTGRPSHRLRDAVIVYAVTVAAIFQIGAVFRKSLEPSAQWPDAWQAVFSLPQVWYLMDGFQALALNAVPAIATIIWLVRRRRAVPPAVRPLISPITVAGVLVASSLVLVHFGFQVFGSLFGGDDTDISAARLLVLVADYFHAGFVAIGVLIAATRRRRAIAVGTRQMLVDLRSATPVVSPSAAAAAIVGDLSASVRYRGPGGGWIDSEGTALGDVGSDRRLLPVVDGAGEVTAGLEVDASTPVPPLLADLAVSAIAARAANERATALADARRRDVRARSRALVAATDAGRITLERNLHDGAQQLLVGLALTAGLRVRQSVLRDGPREAGHPDPIPNEDARDILDEIDRVRREVLDLVDSTAPAVLATGLAGALRSVAAISPIATTLDVAGDLPPDDPLTLGLYLAAGEAMTNAVKHSRATDLQLSLVVVDDRVRMVLRDNGIGGVAQLPPSISRRIAGMDGRAEVESQGGKGTVVRIEVLRSRIGGGQP
jgi:signal transduction histidine kinase